VVAAVVAMMTGNIRAEVRASFCTVSGSLSSSV
jgi:hypothetical protein